MTSLLCLLAFFPLVSAQQVREVAREDVLAAMKKASEFMSDRVSYQGGFLWKYAEDLSEVEGEVPSRRTQIMVQGGTPEMGHLFLELHEATGEEIYLEYAKNAADALIYGQHPLGGWDYIIDFDSTGLESWYKEVASKYAYGWEEYRHHYGNCTFDDNTTQGATAYLLRLYRITGLPEYLGPLQKAMEFILVSQYPNGGWPQRFPLKYELVRDGIPGYPFMYTLNDNAMSNTIDLLLDAYEQLGDQRYLTAARKGGDFFILSQGPEDQAGWAEQFDMNLQPCWGRTHEPPAFMPRQTLNTIRTLEQLFLCTGDRKYLSPIPTALDWLEKCGLRMLEDGSVEAARLYEPGTNLPYKVKVLEERDKEGYHLYEFLPVEYDAYLESRRASAGDLHPVVQQTQGRRYTFDLNGIIALYERINKASDEEREGLYLELFGSRERDRKKPDSMEIVSLINAMNDQGAWIEDIKIWDYKPGHMIEGKKTIKGFTVATYVSHMRRMIDFVTD